MVIAQIQTPIKQVHHPMICLSFTTDYFIGIRFSTCMYAVEKKSTLRIGLHKHFLSLKKVITIKLNI